MANEPNSLGLDFDSTQTTMQPEEPVESKAGSEQGDALEPPPESPVEHPKPSKPEPYINPQRVNTGGPPRVKLSEQELEERMALRRKENEKRKERDLEVEKDRKAFEETQQSERIKQAQNRQVQEQVNRTRKQNAQNKMDKTESRLWDLDKPTRGWNHATSPNAGTEGPNLSQTDTRGWPRGGSPRGRGRGRGRGQGRGGTSRGVGRESVTGSDEKSPNTAPAATTSSTPAADLAPGAA